ncbi:uncharacterized protein [Apostichopus japonicus]|uniref:uncharacterized protein n=1 Tax=Stichopus japonicus TaxID=307972 RepID=UPI003AB2D4CA
MVNHLIFPPCDGNHINGKLQLFSPEISLLRDLPYPDYSFWKKCVQFTVHQQGKCGLISLEMIFGGHLMRILHRMVYNMLIVMVIQLSTFLRYISSKKVKEKVKWEHITADITSFVDESLIVYTVERSGSSLVAVQGWLASHKV